MDICKLGESLVEFRLEIMFSHSRMKVEDERQLFRKVCWKLKEKYQTFYLLVVYSTLANATPTNVAINKHTENKPSI